jgi:peptidoglycan/LPS O-acetylase OafA/YrhL
VIAAAPSASRHGHSAPIRVPQNIAALTGVRFIAAMWVALFHLREELTNLAPPLAGPLSLFDHGHHAVPFFFILSGFILSHAYFPRYQLAQHAHFVFLRLARLWPVHLVMLSLMVAYHAATTRLVFHSQPAYSTLPAEIGMIRCWFDKNLIWNYPAWSIHAEWFAYIFIFPLAFVFFGREKRARVLAPVTLLLLLGHSHLPDGLLPGKTFEIVLLFLAGSSLYQLRNRLLSPHWAHLVYPGLALLGFAHATENSGALLYLSFALILIGLAYEGPVARFVSHRVLVYGGTISYSLYMSHAVVQKLAAELAKRIPETAPALRFSTALLVIVGLVAAAAASYHWIESPGNNFLRQWATRRFARRPQITALKPVDAA